MQKNVLLIVVDQWRGDTLGYLDHPSVRTPNLDALCADGVTFRNHYTQASPCGPARASLLTGLYMMNHRVVQNSIPMDSRHTNLAQEVRALGYQPALVGYTTSTPDPRTTPENDPRFTMLGSLMEGWHPVGAWEPDKRPYFNWLRGKGFDVPKKPANVWLPKHGGPGPTSAPSHIPCELSDTAWATDRAFHYLRHPDRSPWFLHLGYYRPHPPFIAPEPYNTYYDPADMPEPVRAPTAEQEGAQHPLLDRYIGRLRQAEFFQGGEGLSSEMSVDDVKVMRAAYYGLISEVDEHVGRVVNFLKETGQYENTLIVFTCDHGEMLGDHHMLGKMGFFDESFHIPMIVRDPSPNADSTRGTIVDKFTETIDTMPTILEWLGAEVPRACDGKSLIPFLHGETPENWRTEVHFEYDFRTHYRAADRRVMDLHVDQCSLAVIRDEKYKYVHFDALPALFYDLTDDPHQFQNRANDPAYAAKVLEYAQKMLSWRLRFADRTLTAYTSTPKGLVDRRYG